MELTQKPKGVTVIEGFPGFGLVGTIATGFLIDHLGCERIGNHWFEELAATMAIHDGKIVD
ncbi:MAG TPA: PAC2 family protein, partial [Candidatus Binatia bacterium]|nr:PAC2 family protein [Candidatus Binatia bacterium]